MKTSGEWIKRNWYFIIICIVLIIWSGLNISYELCGKELLPFFKASLFNMSTIFISGIFAYIFTRHRDVDSRRKQIAESFINRLLSELDEKMYVIKSEDDVSHIRIIQKRIFEHFKMLNQILTKLNILEETSKIEYTTKRFQDYWDFISKKITDIGYLSDSENILQNIILEIRSKLENILTELYIN